MAQAQANPITYIGKNGKQYVAVNANDYIVARSPCHSWRRQPKL